MGVCVVLVSWNGWAHTLECLESLFRQAVPGMVVVVCDNDSQDGSPDRIREWAEGRLTAATDPQAPLAALTLPPVPKPIRVVEYDRASAEAGGAPGDDAPLVLVRTGSNLGFAGGNNVGLRYVLARGGFEHVWLLNNDTVAAPGALAALLAAARADPGVGMVGSKLLYYDRPDTVQAWGGAHYNSWLALPRHAGAGRRADEAAPEPALRIAYVVGASMLVSTRFVREVGLMSEEYFLYFEEMDWAMRARGRYRTAYAPESVVYHKEGASVGRPSTHRKSWTADYHFMRSRLLFTRKYLPSRLPTVYVALGAAMLRRARHGQWDRVRMIARLCLAR